MADSILKTKLKKNNIKTDIKTDIKTVYSLNEAFELLYKYELILKIKKLKDETKIEY